MTDKQALSAALVDVRKAYRLLAQYQHRVKSTIKSIAEGLETEFYVWEPSFFEQPKRWLSNPLPQWAWDELPMYHTSYLFLSPNADHNKMDLSDWMLDIRLTSDSAYNKDPSSVYKHFRELKNSGYPDPTSFDGVEITSSYLVLYAFKPIAQANLNWYKAWSTIDYPDTLGYVTDLQDKGVWKVYSEQVPLEELGSEAEIGAFIKAFKSKLMELNFIAVEQDEEGQA